MMADKQMACFIRNAVAYVNEIDPDTGKKRGALDSQFEDALAIWAEENQLKDEWKEILIEYQDKLLFATDAHKKHRWKEYSEIVKIYRDILNQLPEEVSKKIAYLNAERIYDIKN